MARRSDILYLLGHENLIFIIEKSGKSQGILIVIGVATMKVHDFLVSYLST